MHKVLQPSSTRILVLKMCLLLVRTVQLPASLEHRKDWDELFGFVIGTMNASTQSGSTEYGLPWTAYLCLDSIQLVETGTIARNAKENDYGSWKGQFDIKHTVFSDDLIRALGGFIDNELFDRYEPLPWRLRKLREHDAAQQPSQSPAPSILGVSDLDDQDHASNTSPEHNSPSSQHPSDPDDTSSPPNLAADPGDPYPHQSTSDPCQFIAEARLSLSVSVPSTSTPDTQIPAAETLNSSNQGLPGHDGGSIALT